MTFIKSILLAFSTFSSIPMPDIKWDEKNMRYMMAAFPLVGLVIAILWLVWFIFGIQLIFIWKRPISLHLIALGFTLIPVFVTGGIHIDGFMDTCDALASRASLEKKLEILKDSHSGAFAVMACVIYFLSYYIFSLELYKNFYGLDNSCRFVNIFMRFTSSLPAVSIFILSRCLSAFAVACFPIAKDSGLVHTFSSNSARFFTAMWSEFLFLSISILLLVFYGFNALAIILPALLVFFFYYFFAKSQFGGITGDTAGFFVQVCELSSLAVFALV